MQADVWLTTEWSSSRDRSSCGSMWDQQYQLSHQGGAARGPGDQTAFQQQQKEEMEDRQQWRQVGFVDVVWGMQTSRCSSKNAVLMQRVSRLCNYARVCPSRFLIPLSLLLPQQLLANNWFALSLGSGLRWSLHIDLILKANRVTTFKSIIKLPLTNDLSLIGLFLRHIYI